MEQKQQPRLVIVGGGTAGWMSALYCQRVLGASWQVVLIASEQIGTIGVGEGTTPYIRQFFQTIGLSESDWMEQCDATYKCGIRFPGWSTQPGFESYYHPFFSALDLPYGDVFFEQANRRRAQPDSAVSAQPEHYFLAHYLSSQGLSPATFDTPGTLIDYAYHFDANKLGDYLASVAAARGIQHISATVTAAKQHADGSIAAVVTQAQDEISGDWFIDCTGFRGLLIEQTLGDAFVPFSDNLLNNAAVAIQTPLDADRLKPTETRSAAMPYGWMWNIPLTRRQGNGYVYSSNFCSADEAEAQLRDALGVDASVPARHLSMRVGRRTCHLRKNCMAIGLSQGFIEPLEATALMLVQFSVARFAANLKQQGEALRHNPVIAESLNGGINQLFDGVRDYIVAHYKTNSRTDTDYWYVNREDTPVSPVLSDILGAWRNNRSLEAVLEQHQSALVYLRPSWYSLLAGVDEFGRYHNKPMPVTAPDADAINAKQYYQALQQRFRMPA